MDHGWENGWQLNSRQLLTVYPWSIEAKYNDSIHPSVKLWRNTRMFGCIGVDTKCSVSFCALMVQVQTHHHLVIRTWPCNFLYDLHLFRMCNGWIVLYEVETLVT